MRKAVVGFCLAAFAAFPLFAQSELRLFPSGDTGEDDLFGGQVALSGSTMVISGQGADSPTIPDSGAAFVFERSGNQWVQTARLMASDARTEDDFGANVGISEDGDTIAVAADQATLDLPFGLGTDAGAVYVFTRTDGGWVQEAELSSPTPARHAGFGFWGMAISGNQIAVGDPGGPVNGFTPVVDVFTRTAGGWQQTATIEIPDDFEFFPQAISMSADTLVVTSPNSSTSIAGAAYVFALQDGVWTRQATLVPADGSFGTFFGSSASLHGNLIAIGAMFSEGVYVFTKGDGGWTQSAKITAADGGFGDSFGASLSITGQSIAIGAPGRNLNGAVYVFRSQDGAWIQLSEIAASDGVPGGAFGDAVAAHDDTLLVGAVAQHPQVDNGQGYPGGEAYVYKLRN